MLVRRFRPSLADRFEEPGKKLATIVFLVIVTGLVIDNWQTIVDEVPEFGAAFVVMMVGSVSLARCGERSRRWRIARAASGYRMFDLAWCRRGWRFEGAVRGCSW